MIVKILKWLGWYVGVKRFKDNIHFYLRERFSFNKEMLHFYKNFVKEGDVCYDLGAAYGNRAATFLKLRACIVLVVEPLEYYQKILRKRFKKQIKNRDVVVRKIAVGDRNGMLDINVSSSPTLSTFASDEIQDIKDNPQMRNVEWIGTEPVQMFTFDNLIDEFGIPDFVKIDVEGYERQVFAGLSHPIKKISFEYHTRFIYKAMECIKMLNRLGNYEYNYSSRETMKFNLGKWVHGREMLNVLNKIPPETDFGDVYCRLKEKDNSHSGSTKLEDATPSSNFIIGKGSIPVAS